MSIRFIELDYLDLSYAENVEFVWKVGVYFSEGKVELFLHYHWVMCFKSER